MSGGEESDHVRLPLQSNPGEDLTPQLHDYIQVCWMTLVCLLWHHASPTVCGSISSISSVSEKVENVSAFAILTALFSGLLFCCRSHLNGLRIAAFAWLLITSIGCVALQHVAGWKSVCSKYNFHQGK